MEYQHTGIDMVRRDLREHSWLKYSMQPFAGAVHNFARPMRQRLESRKYVGPYFYTPSKPGGTRGFYQDSKGLAMGDAAFALRMTEANDHLGESRLRWTTGYYTDDDCSDTMQPIVALLPHGRGFLAGWTMGRGMCGHIDLHIWDNAADAARDAHRMAESDAEKEREYQVEQRTKEDMLDSETD